LLPHYTRDKLPFCQRGLAIESLYSWYIVFLSKRSGHRYHYTRDTLSLCQRGLAIDIIILVIHCLSVKEVALKNTFRNMSLMQFWINFHLYHVDNKWRFDETMMMVSMISMARPTEFFDRKAMYHEYNDSYHRYHYTRDTLPFCQRGLAIDIIILVIHCLSVKEVWP
jgi:hypothetical protein